ncbi:uncharacterized protein (DUF3084 family) [Microvirga lupini]|uniref:Uncharacterized protein (DUF3084 family) n=1 Tax=Microvirga lupini TaxID=420324 RepID=A0A7W4VI98_9HYPH|nr:hypothetical protein [Microvirga lupini]MBB3017733.1 uncharacterized protein (DUF3084 family) [Microvirga lupini]
MISLRTASLAVLAALLLAGAAGGGAVVATWKANAGHGQALQDKDATILRLEGQVSELKLAIAEQNKGVAVAEAQAKAIDDMQAQAQRHLTEMATFSQGRMDKLAKLAEQSTSCGEVLRGNWEMRR